MIKSTLLIIVFVAIYMLSPFVRDEKKAITCKADVSYHSQQDKLDMLITQNLHDGKGVLSLSGIYYENDKKKSYLSKTVSFSYVQANTYYKYWSDLIMDSPQMTMSLSDQKKWLPDFFTEIDKPLLQKIRPYGKNAWVVYSENTPLFVCEKIN